MSDSLFEDILREKAQNFKPTVSPSVLPGIKSGIKAGLNTGVKAGISASGKMGVAKALISKFSLPIISKVLIGVASVATVTTGIYLATNSSENEQTSQPVPIENRIEARATQEIIRPEETKTVTEEKLSTEKKATDEKYIPIAAEEKHDFTNQPAKSTDESKAAFTQNTADKTIDIFAYTPESNAAFILNIEDEKVQDAKIEIAEIVKLKHKKEAKSESKSKTKKLKKRRSSRNGFLGISLLKKKNFKRVKPEPAKKVQQEKISLSATSSIGKTFLLKESEKSPNQTENSTGWSYDAGFAMYFDLNDKWSVGVHPSYVKLDVTTKFLSQSQEDGKITRDLELFSTLAGVQYQFYQHEKWSLKLGVEAGISYKLKHENFISGKYFNRTVVADFSKVSQWNPAANLQLMCNYKLHKNWLLGAGFDMGYNRIDKNLNVIRTGGRVSLTYRF